MHVRRLQAAVLLFNILTSDHLVSECDMIIDRAGCLRVHVVYASGHIDRYYVHRLCDLRGQLCILLSLYILDRVASDNSPLLVTSLAASKVRELVFEDTCLKVRTLQHLVGLLGVLNA